VALGDLNHLGHRGRSGEHHIVRKKVGRGGLRKYIVGI